MKVKEICEYGIKSKVKAGEGLTEGKYKFFTSSAETNKFVNEYQFDKPGIIMGTGGNATLHYCDTPFSVSTDCVVLFPKDKLITKYLYYFFRGNFHILENGFKGAGLKHTSKKYINEIKIKKIPIQETQTKIIDVLDNIEDIITRKKQQLLEYDQLIKSRFVEMFGNVNDNTKKFVQEKLSNHLNIQGGYAFDSKKYLEEGIPILRIGNINTGIFIDKELKYWEYDENLVRYLIKPGDLLITLTGTVGKDDYGNVCIIDNSFPYYYLNQRNAKLDVFDTLTPIYLKYLLLNNSIKNRLTGISRGVRQANISNRDILNLNVPIPSIELQNQFTEFVEQVDKLKFITLCLITHIAMCY